MKRVLIICTLCLQANAADYKQFYVDAHGSRVDTTTAIVKAMGGAEMYKCQSVEAKVSKSGTSIGIKGVKKPKGGAQ